MFDLHEAIKILMEATDESEKPEIIKISAIVNLDDLFEALPDVNSKSFDDQTLDEWYSFVATIEGIIDNLCDRVNISTSNNPDSLSEYIDFYVYDKKGNKKNYLIDLRLSSHKSTEAGRRLRKKRAVLINPKYELEAVTVNNKTFNSYHEAIQQVRKILARHSFN